MSLIEKPNKPPVYRGGRPKMQKTEEQIALDKAKRMEYQRNYQKKMREESPDHFRNLGKKTYYKNKYGLDENLAELYGEFAGDVFKLRRTFSGIVEKQPQLKTHLINLLQEEIPK